jgi:hypothetical protein
MGVCPISSQRRVQPATRLSKFGDNNHVITQKYNNEFGYSLGKRGEELKDDEGKEITQFIGQLLER